MPKKIADIRRAEIVQALHDAIRLGGVSLPSYDQIAREGDMSRQLVRHYYRDPEQMAVDLCDHLAETHRELLARGVLHVDRADRLAVLLDFHFGLLAEKGLAKPEDDAVHDALLAISGRSARVRERLRDHYGALRDALANEIGAAHPKLAAEGCRELADLTVAQLLGHWRMRATLGMAVSDRAARDAIDRLIASYLAASEAREDGDGVPSSERTQSGTMEPAGP